MDIVLQRILSLIPDTHGADKEFAISIGYKSGNIIADWRAGRSTSYHGKVPTIAEVYGVSADWLYGREEQKEKPLTVNGEELGYSDMELLEAIRRADAKDLKAIRVILGIE